MTNGFCIKYSISFQSSYHLKINISQADTLLEIFISWHFNFIAHSIVYNSLYSVGKLTQ
jgi:hypothetical protein